MYRLHSTHQQYLVLANLTNFNLCYCPPPQKKKERERENKNKTKQIKQTNWQKSHVANGGMSMTDKDLLNHGSLILDDNAC